MGSALGTRVAPEDGHLSEMEEGRGAAMVAASSEEVSEDGHLSEMEEGKAQVLLAAGEQASEVEVENEQAYAEVEEEVEEIWPTLRWALVFRCEWSFEVDGLLRLLAKKPPAALCRALEAPAEPVGVRGFRRKLRRVVEWGMEEEDRARDKRWWDIIRVSCEGNEDWEDVARRWAFIQEEINEEIKKPQREELWEKYFPDEEDELLEEGGSEQRWGMAALVRYEVYGDTPLEELGLGSREVLKYLARGNHSPVDDALFRALEELPPLAEAEEEVAVVEPAEAAAKGAEAAAKARASLEALEAEGKARVALEAAEEAESKADGAAKAAAAAAVAVAAAVVEAADVAAKLAAGKAAAAAAAAPHFRAGRVVAESPEEEERLWREMKQRWVREYKENARKRAEEDRKWEEQKRVRDEEFRKSMVEVEEFRRARERMLERTWEEDERYLEEMSRQRDEKILRSLQQRLNSRCAEALKTQEAS